MANDNFQVTHNGSPVTSPVTPINYLLICAEGVWSTVDTHIKLLDRVVDQWYHFFTFLYF